MCDDVGRGDRDEVSRTERDFVAGSPVCDFVGTRECDRVAALECDRVSIPVRDVVNRIDLLDVTRGDLVWETALPDLDGDVKAEGLSVCRIEREGVPAGLWECVCRIEKDILRDEELLPKGDESTPCGQTATPRAIQTMMQAATCGEATNDLAQPPLMEGMLAPKREREREREREKRERRLRTPNLGRSKNTK